MGAKSFLRHGYRWSVQYETYSTTVHDRFLVTVRACDGRWFAPAVRVRYPHARRGDWVPILLIDQQTRDDAMRAALAWVDEYHRRGPWSVAAMLAHNFEHWRDLYKYHWQVLDSAFLRSGSGEEWLDGAVVNNTPDAHRQVMPHPPIFTEDFVATVESMGDVAPPSLIELVREHREDALPVPRLDDGRALSLPVPSEYTPIMCVPPDVRPDWLDAAFDAAYMLRDRSANEPARRAGVEIVAKLHRQFPFKEYT